MRTPQIRYPTRPTGPMTPRPAGRVAAASAILVLFLLAGCTGGGGDANLSPHAELEVNMEEGWTGDEFVFDGRQSSDSDGEITTWRFDFGDGTPPVEVKEDDMAQVSHTYTRGGEFTVTLTVFDDGKENTGALSDADSTNIAVNERMAIASTAISTVPGDDSTATMDVPFQVYEKANRYELNLTFTSVLITGSSEFEVQVLDPSNETVGEKESVTVGPGTQGQSVTLHGLLTKQGVHRVHIEAVSGGGTAQGELRVFYGEDELPR